MWKKFLSFSALVTIGGSAIELFMTAIERVLFAAFTLLLALVGSIIGTVAGGLNGQISSCGFLDGAGKGAVLGVIAVIEVMNFGATLDDPLSKALFSSLLNGEVFMEWIYPAAARAYQHHININIVGTSYGEISDSKGMKGMPHNLILELPFQQFNNSIKMLKSFNISSCSICFQDFEDGELIRVLPKCKHIYHLECIDKWLVQQGSCPMCRTHVASNHHSIIHDEEW